MPKLTKKDLHNINNYSAYAKNMCDDSLDSSGWLDNAKRQLTANYRSALQKDDVTIEATRVKARLDAAKMKGDDAFLDFKSESTRVVNGVKTTATQFKITPIEEEQKKYDTLIGEANDIKKDYNNQRLGLYAYAKNVVASHGGFWKNLFTFHLGRYFSEHNALDDLKATLKEEGFTETALENVCDFVDNPSENKFDLYDGINTDGALVINVDDGKENTLSTNDPQTDKALSNELGKTFGTKTTETSTSPKIDNEPNIQINIDTLEK